MERPQGLPKEAPFYLQPRGNYVAVLRVKPDEKVGREGLLIAPESAVEAPYEGTIQATGPEVKHLQVGQYVLFGRFAGQDGPAIVPGDHVILLREEEVVAVYDKPAFESYVQAWIDAAKRKEEQDAASYLATKQLLRSELASLTER